MSKKKFSYDEALNASIEYFKGDELAASTWLKKYALKDDDAVFEKTPSDMHKRMAKLFFEVEDRYIAQESHCNKLTLSEYGYNRKPLTEERIFELFDKFKYVIPAGSVMSGLGSDMPVSLSNCYVVTLQSDDLDSIFKICNEQSQLMKRRKLPLLRLVTVMLCKNKLC